MDAAAGNRSYRGKSEGVRETKSMRHERCTLYRSIIVDRVFALLWDSDRAMNSTIYTFRGADIAASTACFECNTCNPGRD